MDPTLSHYLFLDVANLSSCFFFFFSYMQAICWATPTRRRSYQFLWRFKPRLSLPSVCSDVGDCPQYRTKMQDPALGLAGLQEVCTGPLLRCVRHGIPSLWRIYCTAQIDWEDRGDHHLCSQTFQCCSEEHTQSLLVVLSCLVAASLDPMWSSRSRWYSTGFTRLGSPSVRLRMWAPGGQQAPPEKLFGW